MAALLKQVCLLAMVGNVAGYKNSTVLDIEDLFIFEDAVSHAGYCKENGPNSQSWDYSQFPTGI